MNIFEQASRLKLRFDLNGNISAEQLWEIKGSGNSLEPLISYEEHLTEIVESYGKSSRRKNSGHKTKDQELNELRLAIVSSILDTRIKEQEEAASAAETKAHNAKIDAMIAEKQDQQLANLSVEELLALRK